MNHSQFRILQCHEETAPDTKAPDPRLRTPLGYKLTIEGIGIVRVSGNICDVTGKKIHFRDDKKCCITADGSDVEVTARMEGWFIPTQHGPTQGLLTVSV